MSNITIDRIAKLFSKQLATTIGEENLQTVIQLNEKQRDQNICHSHDFCDANILMHKAFTSILGIEPPAESQVYTDAWQLAKRKRFYI